MRPALGRFTDRIERQTSHIKDGEWHEKTTSDLLGGVAGDLATLKRVHEMLRAGVTSPEMYEEISRCAADAAALLMMISDNAELRRLKAVLV